MSLRTSTNGGQTWTAISGAALRPARDGLGPALENPANRVYLGNDGGMYRSDTNGVNGSWTKATNQPWNQSYHFAVSQQDAQRMTTGLQDNGSVRTWTADGAAADRSGADATGTPTAAATATGT